MSRVLAPLLVVFTSIAAQADDAWQPLFNGRDLTGWTAVEGPIESWSVADGVLSCSGQRGTARFVFGVSNGPACCLERIVQQRFE